MSRRRHSDENRGHLTSALLKEEDTDRSRQDRQGEAIPVLDTQMKAELKRLALLFLISSITLAVVIADALVRAVAADVVPNVVLLMLQMSWIGGGLATYFYGLYVTIRARAWRWVVPCAIPLFGSVPACVAYSWIRRGELERLVLEEEQHRAEAVKRR